MKKRNVFDCTLTVVIMDLTNFIHLQEPVTHRTVRIELTEEQVALINPMRENESISHVYVNAEYGVRDDGDDDEHSST